jgi:hypothetical protein
MRLAAGLGSLTELNYTSLLYDNKHTFQFFFKSLKCQPKPSIPSNHLIGFITVSMHCFTKECEGLGGMTRV